MRPVAFKGAEYIRIGSLKKKLKDHPDKEAKIWAKASRTTFQNRIAKESLSDDDVLNLLDYPKYFELMNAPLPQGKEGIINKLLSESLISKSKSLGYEITNLGAILFAKDLHNFPGLERKSLRVVIYKGKNRIDTIKESLGKVVTLLDLSHSSLMSMINFHPMKSLEKP